MNNAELPEDTPQILREYHAYARKCEATKDDPLGSDIFEAGWRAALAQRQTPQSKDAATDERDALAERLHHEALSTGKGTCPPSWSGHWRDWYRLRADEILAQRTEQAQDDAEGLAQFIAGWCEQHPGYEYNELADAIVARSKA